MDLNIKTNASFFAKPFKSSKLSIALTMRYKTSSGSDSRFVLNSVEFELKHYGML